MTAHGDKRDVDQGGEGDDLDSLVVHAPAATTPATPAADDDIIDLRALSALSVSTRPGAAEEDDGAGRAPQSKRMAWLLPLLLGFLAGMPAGAWVFGGEGASLEAPPVPPPPPSERPSPAPPVVAAAPSERVTPLPTPAAPASAPRAVEPAAATLPPSVRAPQVPRAVVPPVPAPQPAPTPAVASVQASVARAPAAVPAPAAPVISVTPVDDDPIEAAFPERKMAAVASDAPRTMDTLLDDALVATGQTPLQLSAAKPAAPPNSDIVPLSPSRDDVSAAMSVLVPAIRGCAMGASGMATAAIVVQSDGKVASVKVTGAPFEGASSGRCMEGVVRRARFPRFRQPLFRVQFPFVIE